MPLLRNQDQEARATALADAQHAALNSGHQLYDRNKISSARKALGALTEQLESVKDETDADVAGALRYRMAEVGLLLSQRACADLAKLGEAYLVFAGGAAVREVCKGMERGDTGRHIASPYTVPKGYEQNPVGAAAGAVKRVATGAVTAVVAALAGTLAK